MGKLIRRILVGVLAAVAALIVFLAGSVLVDRLLGGGRLDAVTNVRIANTAGPEVRAYLARPAGPGPHPAVIMIHEWWGLNQDIRQKADLLAQAGYVVVAPDAFRGSTTGWVPTAIYQVIGNPAEQVNADLDAVFAWLAAQPEVRSDRIAIMGFCFGGRTSLLFSLHNPGLAATAVFYGGPVTDAERLKSLPGPVLGIFGGADGSIPLADVDAFETALARAGVENQISVYDGQPHAFVSSVEAIQAGGAPGRAWDELLGFLEQTLKGDAVAARPTEPARADDPFGWSYLMRLAWSHVAADGHEH